MVLLHINLIHVPDHKKVSRLLINGIRMNDFLRKEEGFAKENENMLIEILRILLKKKSKYRRKRDCMFMKKYFKDYSTF